MGRKLSPNRGTVAPLPLKYIASIFLAVFFFTAVFPHITWTLSHEILLQHLNPLDENFCHLFFLHLSLWYDFTIVIRLPVLLHNYPLPLQLYSPFYTNAACVAKENKKRKKTRNSNKPQSRLWRDVNEWNAFVEMLNFSMKSSFPVRILLPWF